MATLYHDNRVRYFRLTDDHPLAGLEADALCWLESLEAHLRRHKVRNISLGMNTRGDHLTPAIQERLRRLGLVRTLMGVESANPQNLKALGRRGDASAGMTAMQQMASAGVLVWFNSIFLQPDSRVETVRQELASLQSVSNALFNTIKLRPFAGTPLDQRLARRHRRFAGVEEILKRLQAEIPQVNHLRLTSVTALLDAAQDGADDHRIITMGQEAVSQLMERLDGLERQLESTCQGQVSRHYGHVAAAATLLMLLGSTSPACHSVDDPFDDTHDTTADDGDRDEVKKKDTAAADGDVDGDADMDTDIGLDSEPWRDTEWQLDEYANGCNYREWHVEFYALSQRSSNTGIRCPNPLYAGPIATLDNVGRVVKIEGCWDVQLSPEEEACYLELLNDDSQEPRTPGSARPGSGDSGALVECLSITFLGSLF